MRRVALALVLTVLAASAGAQQPTPVPVTESMEAWRARVNAAIRAETSLLREIYRVESAEFEAVRRTQALEGQIAGVEQNVARTESEIVTLDRDSGRLRERLGRRLRYMNLMRDANLARMLFRSKSVSSFLRRWRAVKWIAKRDREQMIAFTARRAALRQRREELIGQRHHLESLRQSRQTNSLEAQIERQKRAILLDEIRRDRALAERAGREFAAAREDADLTLSETVDAPGDAPPPDSFENSLEFESRRGTLPMPTVGAIVHPFGPIRNVELGTVTRNNGIDILAAEGAPVIAVADGQVRFAGEFLGYGRVVILDHGGRHHTMYGHLDRVLCAKNDWVRAGRAIGTVGATGSLSGPLLHFEIRQRGTAVDPNPWLGSSR